MRASRWGVLGVLVVGLGLAGLAYRHCFRCQTRSVGKVRETVCFAWGHPTTVRISDPTGRPMSFARLFRGSPYTDTEAYLADLFGSGRISQIVRVQPSDDEYGDIITEEISTADDQRFDLLVFYRGRALVAGFSVAPSCSRWVKQSISVAQRRVVASRCIDSAALLPVGKDEALKIVERLSLPEDRRLLATTRIASATERLAPALRM